MELRVGIRFTIYHFEIKNLGKEKIREDYTRNRF
jgi:hypothetical protein